MHAHVNQGKLWQDWLKKGGDKIEMKKGKDRMKKWQGEWALEEKNKEAEKKDDKSLDIV